MALQARAEATRRRILDSAVDLFSELGYGETGLADVLQRAGVSKGAFYYHFESKEAVAAAIIEEYTQRSKETMRTRLDTTQPRLDQIITATFVAAEMLEYDKVCRIGNQLLQALEQVSSVASKVYSQWTQEFTASLAIAIEQAGLSEGDEARQSAEAIWTGILGCHLLSSALNDDPYSRLVTGWRSMMRANVPAESLQHYYDVIDAATNGLQKAR